MIYLVLLSVQKYHAEGIPAVKTAGLVIYFGGLKWTLCDVKTMVHFALSL